ncbi:MAG: ABC transporter transmembrane domain-containing protein [Eggerthellaceae bacterium]
MVLVVLLRMVLYAPILAVGGMFMVSSTNFSMSWIIALAVAAIFVVIFILMAVAMPKFKIMQKLIDRVNLVSREMLNGISVIRAFGRQSFEEDRFDEANVALMKTQLFTNMALTFMMPAMMLIMNAVSVLIVWVGGSHIDSGAIQTGDMMRSSRIPWSSSCRF